ncbi:MAG: glycosyltransferase [Planctomycetaceae bacterium]|nr:glycosyltransferase [Planctomycetaceae bacterium]
MARIGLTCPEMSGHLNPTCALGRELHLRGHEVTFFGLRDAEDHVHNAGLAFHPIGEREFPQGSWRTTYAELGRLQGLRALQSTIQLYKRSTRVFMRELPEALRTHEMDGMVVDQTSLAGAAVADYLNLPFVSLACALMMNSEPGIPPMVSPWMYRDHWTARLRNRVGDYLFQQATRGIPRLINRYRRQWNLPLYKSREDTFSPFAQIAQAPREFDFPREALPAVFHYTGPLHTPESRPDVPFPYEKLNGKPLLYASLGTLQNRIGHIFQTIVDACQGLELQLVLSIGGGDAGNLQNLPDSAIVVDFAPQLELLRRADLAITHAGMNTVMEALSQGVPLICLPVTNDQPAVAARVAWTQTGTTLPLKSLAATNLREAIQRLLTQDIYQHRARQMQVAIEQAGGLERAADIVESAVFTGKPVLAPFQPTPEKKLLAVAQ